jgi:hypothetical protein
MRKAFRLLLALVLALVLLIAASPLLLYALGLSGVEGRPERPTVMASAEEQARVWKLARGEGTPVVQTLNPYGVVLDLWSDSPPSPPAEHLAYWVASSHLAEHRPPLRGTGSWHLQCAALSIWLTRHWTAEELLTAAYRTGRVRRSLERGGESKRETAPMDDDRPSHANLSG